MLVFHIVFGRAVPDVSLNSPANLGYADVRFLRPVYPGRHAAAETEVIGKRETSRTDVGIVWVQTKGYNQRDEPVLHFYRWAMVNKRDPETNDGRRRCAGDAAAGAVEDLYVPPELDLSKFDPAVTGGGVFWEDYEPGERILHPQGLTIEDAEHQMATRLYQNNARVHFNEHAAEEVAAGDADHLRRAHHFAVRTRSRTTGSRTPCASSASTRARTRTRRSPATRCSRGRRCSTASTSAAPTPGRFGCGWWA